MTDLGLILLFDRPSRRPDFRPASLPHRGGLLRLLLAGWLGQHQIQDGKTYNDLAITIL